MQLTHKDGVPYLDYVRAVGENPIARRVKVADLRHNGDLTRLDEVGPKDLARLIKYRKARVILGDMATEVQTPAGPVGMRAAGEPYPFEVRDESADGFTLEADVLPLSVDEKVELRYDFGPVVAQGVNELGARTCTRLAASPSAWGLLPRLPRATPACLQLASDADATVTVRAVRCPQARRERQQLHR